MNSNILLERTQYEQKLSYRRDVIERVESKIAWIYEHDFKGEKTWIDCCKELAFRQEIMYQKLEKEYEKLKKSNKGGLQPCPDPLRNRVRGEKVPEFKRKRIPNV